MLTKLGAISVALALMAGCATPTSTRAPDKVSAAPANPSAASLTPPEVTEADSAKAPDASVSTEPAEPVAPPVPTTAPEPMPPPPPPPSPAPPPPPPPAPAPEPPPAVVLEAKQPVAARPVQKAPKEAPTVAAKAPVMERKPPEPVVLDAQMINGRLELVAGPRQSVTPDEMSEGMVYFLPTQGAPRPKPGRFTISTKSKGFTPSYLVVPVGSTVSFPNRDSVLHNVYSRTPGSSFELGTFGPGESKEVVLDKPGLVIVNCNVHSTMRANVLVLGTPYYTRPAKDGSFQLKDVPAGTGTLVFWHPRANAASLPMKANRDAPVVQRLVATKARIEAHSAAGH